ncbi:pre-mRNA processing factor 3-domain-containing protein [Cantharellus anzutake]|uniref:pre-mRNA processing factor 3-domain-containing protein n=1 Tax=Cantharellus anzutake TaxID=1750568 RepID=UPI0019089692|nr:pre-mRNA processing factor 3-domain-containing protein [Cantharellus anzutake]KAF8317789.1 pre-mRNA processing factor 3-domain-containing protein [Cantharellus anzutake]
MASFGVGKKLGGPSPSQFTVPALSSTSASLPARPAAATTPTLNLTEMARQVAEAKRLAATSLANKAVQQNPYLSLPTAGKKKVVPEPAPVGSGLKTAVHPLLLDPAPLAPQSSKDRYKPMQPKFASIKANARIASASPAPPTPPSRPPSTAEPSNPYATTSTTLEGGFQGAPRMRVGGTFRFNPKGKYVQLAEQMRKEAQLGAIKQRIAERAAKAGLDSEFEVLEKNIRSEAPPEVEWWDVALLPNKTYDDLDLGMDVVKIRTEDSPINEYVQHPIPIPAPWDKNAVPLKPLKLTKTETKKIRRNRRKAEQQDKQDRIRMGLIPPDPPKVRLANLMKVLTSDAVQDPTKVEARVRREVAMRKLAHDKMNESRKLTDEQRRQKIENKKLEEEKKGLFGAVYKIKTLKDPSHRFKVRKNAEQCGLTGITLFNPNYNLVIVEGSAKAIKQYNRLMTVRINWTQAAQARHGDDDEGGGETEEKPLNPLEEEEILFNQNHEGEDEEVSLEDNRCDLTWEGPLRDRAFKAFKVRNCPTDTIAKDALGPRWMGHWDLAKSFIPEEEL